MTRTKHTIMHTHKKQIPIYCYSTKWRQLKSTGNKQRNQPTSICTTKATYPIGVLNSAYQSRSQVDMTYKTSQTRILVWNEKGWKTEQNASGRHYLKARLLQSYATAKLWQRLLGNKQNAMFKQYTISLTWKITTHASPMLSKETAPLKGLIALGWQSV